MDSSNSRSFASLHRLHSASFNEFLEKDLVDSGSDLAIFVGVSSSLFVSVDLFRFPFDLDEDKSLDFLEQRPSPLDFKDEAVGGVEDGGIGDESATFEDEVIDGVSGIDAKGCIDGDSGFMIV
jgi:hypothetical protein